MFVVRECRPNHVVSWKTENNLPIMRDNRAALFFIYAPMGGSWVDFFVDLVRLSEHSFCWCYDNCYWISSYQCYQNIGYLKPHWDFQLMVPIFKTYASHIGSFPHIYMGGKHHLDCCFPFFCAVRVLCVLLPWQKGGWKSILSYLKWPKY